MKKILDIDENPNGIILWKCIKDTLVKQKKITVSGMNFDVRNDDESDNDSDSDDDIIGIYDEDDLIKDFKKIHKKRLSTDNI